MYHQKTCIHALDKQLDTITFFVLIEQSLELAHRIDRPMIHFEYEIARFDTGPIGLAAGLHVDNDDTVGIAKIVLLSHLRR